MREFYGKPWGCRDPDSQSLTEGKSPHEVISQELFYGPPVVTSACAAAHADVTTGGLPGFIEGLSGRDGRQIVLAKEGSIYDHEGLSNLVLRKICEIQRDR